ncbi:hypothetical protein BC629DRAFT_557413 [Irpex lacteus]|nr:hypothetical protein BC629DRAFT_557413 [Irpex lacteus]
MKNIKKRIHSAFRSSRRGRASTSSDLQPATQDTLIDAFIRTSAGDTIPPELFEVILMFAGTDDRRREVEQRLRRDRSVDWVQRQIEVHKAGPMYTLKSCSLVCRYWAKQCRQYLFRDARIHITSFQSAEDFRLYTRQGSPALGPSVASFIKTIHVVLDYKVAEPFLHLIYLPQTRNKLIELQVRGPFPEKLPLLLRSTPHWNLAHNASSTPPAVVAYKTITLTNLEFASFKSVLQYLQHFGDVESLKLFFITWDPSASPIPLTFITSARRPPSHRRKQVAVTASGCTSNLLLCLHAAMMYADFPLRGIPDSDQNWIVGFLTRTDKFYADVPAIEVDREGRNTYSLASCRSYISKFSLSVCPGRVLTANLLTVDRTRADRPSVSFEVFGGAADYPQLRAHFVCKPRPPLKGRESFGPVRLLGVAIVIDPPFRKVSPEQMVDRTIDLTAVRKELGELCAVRVVVIALADYGALKALVGKHKALGAPLNERLDEEGGDSDSDSDESGSQGKDSRKYILACKRSEEYPFPNVPGGDGRLNKTWVGIDPITLEATGDNWVHDRDIVPSLFESL